MSWQNIFGHDKTVEQFRRAFHRRRMAGTFFFTGPSGIGKRRFAAALAQSILCKAENNLEPCGECDSCKMFSKNPSVTDWDFDEHFTAPHPDLYYVAKPADRSELPLDLIIGNKENRGHSGLIYNISRTAFLGHKKAAIINDADCFNEEGANALLKTLEEPPTDSIIILIGTSTARQLPTIISRSQVIRFSPLPKNVLATLLTEKGIAASPAQAEKIAEQADGSLERAMELLDDDIEGLRTEIFRLLTASKIDANELGNKMNVYIEAKGKEGTIHRRRALLVFRLSMQIFRSQIQKSHNAAIELRRLSCTIDAVEQVENNVYLPVLVELWATNVARCL